MILNLFILNLVCNLFIYLFIILQNNKKQNQYYQLCMASENLFYNVLFVKSHKFYMEFY